MYVDRDIDALMERTKGRPLVTGEVAPTEALVFASLVEAAAFVWLWFLVNPLSAVLALAACAFYVFVYTIWLKRTSVDFPAPLGPIIDTICPGSTRRFTS